MASSGKGGKRQSAIELCEETVSQLARDSNALRRRLSSCAAQGEGFSRAMEKVEEQLRFAGKRLGRRPAELDLNEVAILSEKISAELEELEPAAFSAHVASEQKYIAREFAGIKAALGKMSLQVADMKKRARKAKLMPGKIALLSFANMGKLCKDKLSRLSRMMRDSGCNQCERVASAKGEAAQLRTQADELLLKMEKSRLKGRIGATRSEIICFMRRTGSGRVFLDHKHLTLRSGHDRLTLSFSPEVKYCLEELAPVSHWLSNVGKNAVVVGSFQKHDGGALLRIGERSVVGSSIVYRECSVLIS